MPEEAAAEQTESAEPKEVVLVRGPKGRFQKGRPAASKLPSLTDRMIELERREKTLPKVAGDTTAAEGEEQDDEGEGEHEAPLAGGGDAAATNGKSAPAADPAKPPEPKPKRETVEVEGKPNFAQERLEFTEWKRKQREALDADFRARRKQFDDELRAERSKFDEDRGKFSPRVEKAEKVLQFMESADYEALAKEAGYEDWDKFQNHVLGTITDPNYKETRALRRELEERKAKEKAEQEAREKAETERRAQQETHAKQQQRAQAIAQHKQGLSEAMAKSTDRTVAAMADDPVFVNTVFEIQKQNYDPSTKSTVSPEQAIRMALRGGQRTVHEELTLLYQRLRKAVGEEAAQQAVAAATSVAVPTDPAKPKASKTAVVPSSATVEPAAAGKWGGPKSKAWRDYAKKRLDEAEEAEEQKKTGRR
jgi:hypothetical protein